MKKNIYLLLLFCCSNVLFAQSQELLDVQKLDRLLNKNQIFATPMILENYILFYYKGKAKSVILSGEFNNWQDNWHMIETKTNLWTFALTNRLQQGIYKYRLKVDGFWIADTENNNFVYDSGQQKLSILTLTNDFIPNKKYPLWLSNDIYLFKHVNTNARSVNIVGDFNDWNPYTHPMKYLGAGEFEIELELAPKSNYIYSFVQDGEWTFDENNKKQFLNKQHRPVSVFYADRTNSKP